MLKNDAFSYPRTIFSISAYAAHGFKNNWNILATYALVDLTPQDFKLAVSKQVLNHHNWFAVLGGGFFGPSSNYETESGDAVGQRASGLWLEHIVQYRGTSWHIDGGLSYYFTQNPTPDNWQAHLIFGKSFKKWYLKSFTTNQQSLGNKYYRGIGEEMPDSFRELAVSFFKTGAQIIYTASAWQPYIGISQIISGNNTFQSTGISLGVIRTF